LKQTIFIIKNRIFSKSPFLKIYSSKINFHFSGALMNSGSRASAATLYQYSNGGANYDFSTEQWDGQIHSQPPVQQTSNNPLPHVTASTSHLPTPSSTPTAQRKNRRISNIFVSLAFSISGVPPQKILVLPR
jgi:hypothetical protein